MSNNLLAHETCKQLDRRSDLKMFPAIYFLSVADDATHRNLRIKNGITTDWKARLEQHRATGLGAAIVVNALCVLRGQQTHHDAIKRRFRHLRWNGETEVFHPKSELVDYIRWLRDQAFVWVPEEEGTCVEDCDVVDAGLWLPQDGRTKPPPPQRLLAGEHGPLRLPDRIVTADDFYTSEVIIECVQSTMGGIDLDPASHAVANSIVQATAFYSQADNGLLRPWYGRVWLNPPFSQWSLWVGKVLGEWKVGRVQEMCVLAATRTLTAKYFAPLVAIADAMCIFRGRIAFWGLHATPAPDDGHAVFYFGSRRHVFRNHFGALGTVYYKSTPQKECNEQAFTQDAPPPDATGDGAPEGDLQE